LAFIFEKDFTAGPGLPYNKSSDSGTRVFHDTGPGLEAGALGAEPPALSLRAESPPLSR
ncbi:hypothetical protein J6590_100042, partial [Homalodisca vitripennis]